MNSSLIFYGRFSEFHALLPCFLILAKHQNALP